MVFAVKKQPTPQEEKEYCLSKEREYNLGRHMQFMPTDIRMKNIKRRESELALKQSNKSYGVQHGLRDP